MTLNRIFHNGTSQVAEFQDGSDMTFWLDEESLKNRIANLNGRGLDVQVEQAALNDLLNKQ